MEGVGARCNFSEVHAISLSTLVALGKSFCQVIRSEFPYCAVLCLLCLAVLCLLGHALHFCTKLLQRRNKLTKSACRGEGVLDSHRHVERGLHHGRAHPECPPASGQERH